MGIFFINKSKKNEELVEINRLLNEVVHNINDIKKHLQLPVIDRESRISARINHCVKNMGFSLQEVEMTIDREFGCGEWNLLLSDIVIGAMKEMDEKKQIVRKEIESGKTPEDVYKRYEHYDGQKGLYEYAKEIYSKSEKSV